MPPTSPVRSATTTESVLAEIGGRLRRYRLQQNRTLEDVANDAGVTRLTAHRAESGRNPTLATLIRLLRALGRLDALDAFLPDVLISPMELAERGGRIPQRARARKSRRGPV